MATNHAKGRAFEQWLANYYGKSEGLAERTGYETTTTSDGRKIQSGVDVRGTFWGAQAKKGPSFYPKKIRQALDTAVRDSGRRMPVVMAADNGEALDHIVVMRGSDFKRIQDLLLEHGIAEHLLIGYNFGS